MAMSVVISVSATGKCCTASSCAMKPRQNTSIGFVALRVYALHNKSRVLFAIVLVLGMLNPAIFIVSAFLYNSNDDSSRDTK